MPRFFIDLRDRDFERLAELAERSRRPPRDQAAWMLEEALRERRKSAAEGADHRRSPLARAAE